MISIKNTVDFQSNYDDTEKNQLYYLLASRIFLVNGTAGIAVGMATNIPPHNLSGVVAAIDLLMDNPDVTTNELMEVLPGPDFPTGGFGYGKIRNPKSV